MERNLIGSFSGCQQNACRTSTRACRGTRTLKIFWMLKILYSPEFIELLIGSPSRLRRRSSGCVQHTMGIWGRYRLEYNQDISTWEGTGHVYTWGSNRF